jgi:hypothetical protein
MRIQLAIAAVLAGSAIAALIAWENTRVPPAGEIVYSKIGNNRYFRDRMRGVTPITDYTPPAESGAVSKDGYSVTKFAVPGGVKAFLRPDQIVDDHLFDELRGRFRDESDVKRAIEVERAKLLSLSERAILDAILAADPALLRQEDETSQVIRKTLLLTAINPVQTALLWTDRGVFAITYSQATDSGEGVVIIFQFDDAGKLILNARMNVDHGTPPERVRAAITALTRVQEPPEGVTTSAPSP